MSLNFGIHPEVIPAEGTDVVKEVRAFVVGTKQEEEEGGGGADCHSQAGGHWIVDTPIANPMSRYQSFKSSRKSWGIDAFGTVVVEVEMQSGVVGVGVSIGGEAGCYIIEQHLARFVEGQDPHNTELIWDQMYRSSVYGRKGLVIMAMSAIDLALWDVIGKLAGKPVYQLLGGKTKQRLPVYATTARPDLAKRLGFVGAKFPLPYGPADGDAGMRRNIERVKEVRESVGPDFPIMIDCYMSLTTNYACELARRIKEEVPGGVKWIEEMLHPDDYDGYAEIKRRVSGFSSILCTTGEHEWTRYGFRQLLERKCCDVLQPDITWVGGVTEARRIVAMASAYDIPVIPHGSSVFSYHLQYAFPNTPIAEFLILSPRGDEIVPLFGALFTDEPLPKNGYVDLPDRPGFGVTLNREGITLRRPHTRTVPMVRELQEAKAARCPDQEEWLGRAGKIGVVDARGPRGTALGSIYYGVSGARNEVPGRRIWGSITSVRNRAVVMGGNFAVWGGLFSIFDCSLAALRRTEDAFNPILSGALTGGLLAVRSGPKAIIRNGVVGGVLLAAIEGAMHWWTVSAQEKEKVRRAEEYERMYGIPYEDSAADKLEPPVPGPRWVNRNTGERDGQSLLSGADDHLANTDGFDSSGFDTAGHRLADA